MTDPLKAAARAGDPKALEALMNKFFGSKGITVRVTSTGSLLRVLLRGTSAPDKRVLTVIRQGLGSIKPAGFDKVIVTARATGEEDSWSEQWELAPALTPAPPPSKPAVKTVASSQPPTAWYKKSWLIITLLVFFPFVGIPLVWTSQWSKDKKIGTSIVSGIWLLAIFVQDPNPTPTITAQESQQESSVDEPAEAEVVEAPETALTDYLAEGKEEGYSAAVAAQTATGNDWNDVGLGWDAAMRSLGKVPADSPDYAEAQAKIAEYTVNQEAAAERYRLHQVEANQAKIEATRAQAEAKAGALDSYRAEIRRIDPSGQLIVRVEPDPFLKDCDSCIDIVVASGFLSQNKATRLEAAKQLWTIWVLHSGVTSADKARIRLVTQSGTKVGGSGMMGGSMISVDD